MITEHSATFHVIDDCIVEITCRKCDGDGWPNEHECSTCWGSGFETIDVTWLRTLVRNLVTIGGLSAAFRAGDNHGFHMGEDGSSQCTCQWAPGRGVPYLGATRCEFDDFTWGEALKCCPRFTWGDGGHDIGCEGER